MKDNILISGITGFVGRNLKNYLKEKYNTKGVSRKSNSNKNIISYKELIDSNLNSSTTFVHLAGKAHDLKGVSNDSEYFDVNTELTKTLFNQFLESDCEVFVYMSSVKAAADVFEGTLTEKVKPRPITAYGRSKLAAESFLMDQELKKGKKLYILRPCMIHGSGNKGNLNLLYKFVKTGIPYPLGLFKNKRSFASVENVCFIIEQLIKKKPVSGIYNLADDKAISTVELMQIIGEGTSKKVTILNIHKKTVEILAGLGTFLNLPFNKERLQKLTENYIVDNTKIKNILQIELPQSTKGGLLRTIESFNK